VSHDPFTAGFDLRGAFRRTASEGFAFIPGALDAPFRRRLHREVQAALFEPAPGSVGQVRQEIETCTLPRDLEGYPEVAELREALMATARGSGVRGLLTWRPDDIAVQRYRPGSLGITSHRDGKRFRRLIAVLTAAGSAGFAVRTERHGEVVAGWEAGPGSLVLLRGPGLAGVRDGRLFHEVSGPREGVRYSVGFRMEVATGPGAEGRRPSGPR
jgi:hypothetical protein